MDVLVTVQEDVPLTSCTQEEVLLTLGTKGPREARQAKMMFDHSTPNKCMEQQEMLKALMFFSKENLAVLQETLAVFEQDKRPHNDPELVQTCEEFEEQSVKVEEFNKRPTSLKEGFGLEAVKQSKTPKKNIRRGNCCNKHTFNDCGKHRQSSMLQIQHG